MEILLQARFEHDETLRQTSLQQGKFLLLFAAA